MKIIICTYDKKINFIQERNDLLYGYEITWTKDKIKPPADWLNTYPNAQYTIITKDTYLGFIVEKSIHLGAMISLEAH